MSDYTSCDDCLYFLRGRIYDEEWARICGDPALGGLFEFLPAAEWDMRKLRGAANECWPSMSHFVPRVKRA